MDATPVAAMPPHRHHATGAADRLLDSIARADQHAVIVLAGDVGDLGTR